MSPIAGFSDKTRIERLGKIKLGTLVPSLKDPSRTRPLAAEHFVYPPEVAAVIGEKATRLFPIMFPTNNPDDWMSQFYRCYKMSFGLCCIGDGGTARRMIDVATGALVDKNTQEGNWVWRDITCEGEECEEFQRKLCFPTMCLKFLLPDVPGLGVWDVWTKSRNSRLNIQSMIKFIMGVTGGRPSFIPLVLSLAPQEATPVGSRKKTIWVIHLQVPEGVSLSGMRTMADEISRGHSLQLASPAAQTLEAALKEDVSDDIATSGDDEETTGAQPPSEKKKTPGKKVETKGAGPETAGQKTEPPPPTREKIKELDVVSLVDNLFGPDGWQTVAVPMMKEKLGVESYDKLDADQALFLWTALKAKAAVENAPGRKPGPKATPPTPADAAAALDDEETLLRGFVKAQFGPDGWEKVAIPLLKEQFGVEALGQLDAGRRDRVRVALNERVREENRKAGLAPSSIPPKKKALTESEKAVWLLRKQFGEILQAQGMTKETGTAWLQKHFNRDNTENMTKDELEAAIAKAKAVEEEPPIF
jgi:hypothetical protein